MRHLRGRLFSLETGGTTATETIKTTVNPISSEVTSVTQMKGKQKKNSPQWSQLSACDFVLSVIFSSFINHVLS